jgi:hypothetical protein
MSSLMSTFAASLAPSRSSEGDGELRGSASGRKMAIPGRTAARGGATSSRRGGPSDSRRPHQCCGLGTDDRVSQFAHLDEAVRGRGLVFRRYERAKIPISSRRARPPESPRGFRHSWPGVPDSTAIGDCPRLSARAPHLRGDSHYLLIGYFSPVMQVQSWWIAPRRSGVRVPLAPLANLLHVGGFRVTARHAGVGSAGCSQVLVKCSTAARLARELTTGPPFAAPTPHVHAHPRGDRARARAAGRTRWRPSGP